MTAGSGQRRLTYLVTGAALVAIIVIYWPTLQSMIEIWRNSETYAHGVIIFPISAYLVWLKRDAIAEVVPGLNFVAVPVLAGLSLLWLLAHLVGVQVVQQLAWVAILCGVVWALLGTPMSKLLAFPLAFLFFAVPFGSGLTEPLMEFTASFTVRALQFSGIPVYRDGLYFSIPSGDFEVARACSGIRYLIASVALGTLFAYLTYRSTLRRLVFVAVAIVVPIVANGLRAYGIVLIAHLSDMKLAVGVDHFVYGWVFFGLVMFLVFWIGMAFRQDTDPEPATTGKPDAGPPTAGVLAGAVVAVLAGAAVGPVVALSLATPLAGQPVRAVVLPAVPDWHGPEDVDFDWRPAFHDADSVSRGRYRSGVQTVTAYVFSYHTQGSGSELINGRNAVFDGKEWRRTRFDSDSFSLEDGVLSVRVSYLTRHSRDLLVWHWYDIGGTWVAGDVRAKWREAWNVLLRRPAVSHLVAVATEYDDEIRATRRLRDFMTAYSAGLRACLQEVDAPCPR